MRNLAAGPEPVKIDHARGHDPAWPPSEAAHLANCEAVFGDSLPIPVSDGEALAERHLRAAREAMRRAREATPDAATDWKAEALRELASADAALDTIPPAEQGRVQRAVVAGLRDDVAELRAVLAGER